MDSKPNILSVHAKLNFTPVREVAITMKEISLFFTLSVPLNLLLQLALVLFLLHSEIHSPAQALLLSTPPADV